ncbi:MAG: 1,6-anhydro-N-acetylmuramyl-L-alanine amidase AmpD [Gammaproteobacteria bacterium]|nr:1,6-anhydro-N-acetylmuramyl-L-alanine amidase AmpD [Gammaproteobacteria bacterium]
MRIDLTSGLVEEARQQPSPNCDSRPEESDIGLIVIHGISLPPGKFGDDYIDQLFCNKLNPEEHPYFKEISGLKVSSHLLVRRDGEVVQYVPLHKRAWHAGVSSYKNRECCNDFSIGIELEGEDETPYTDIQYQILSKIIKSLINTYPALNQETIVGHSDIAPGRKTDPGTAFDWELLNKLVSPI